MGEVIKLPPYDAVKLKYVEKNGSYKEYQLWRKSTAYKLWLKRQWAKQDGKCRYCHISLKGIKHVVEHMLPQRTKSRYVNQSNNLVLSCTQCNKKKGSVIYNRKKRRRIVI